MAADKAPDGALWLEPDDVLARVREVFGDIVSDFDLPWWICYGVKGVRLKASWCGDTWNVEPADLERWIAQVKLLQDPWKCLRRFRDARHDDWLAQHPAV
jgi:hypothetical protein